MLWLIVGFSVVVLLGSALSPYWTESVSAIRRTLVPMLLVFVLLTSQRVNKMQNLQVDVALLSAWSLIYAFVVRTVFALSDWLRAGVHTDYFTINRSVAKFFNFYAIDASLVVPVVVAACLYLSMPRVKRAVLWVSIGICILLIMVSSVRTAMLAVALATLFQFVFAPKIKKLWLAIGVSLFAFGLLAVPSTRIEKAVDRYATIFSKEAYQGSATTGVSSIYERISIWKGSLEMVRDRPLLGYGLGWQKFYNAAYDGGYVDRWRLSQEFIDQTVANYFDTKQRGQVNPHNLWVEVMFETGLLGLFGWLSILGLLVYRAVRVLRCNVGGQVGRWFGAATIAYVFSYLMVNTMGGFWLLSGATLMLMVVSEQLRQQQLKNSKAPL